jgi:GTP-binding protein LepA
MEKEKNVFKPAPGMGAPVSYDTRGGTPPERIRNFCIIAHIDHGKSTLADRILEFTGAITKREMKEQFLDKMDLERERGITIKAQAVRLFYNASDGKQYQLHLIDTPGHVDFTYEVSRSLAACEGALLVVDATQGVEAQTLANVYLALEQNLELIPVINKVDLPSAQPEAVKEEIEEVVGLDASEAVHASAKMGIGIGDILEAVVKKVPPPKGSRDKPFRALIFDSWFDSYRGVIVLFRVVEGEIKKGSKIQLFSNKKVFEVTATGTFTPHHTEVPVLKAGEVGFLSAAIKEVADARVGDTILDAENVSPDGALAAFQEAKPMVFSGLFPTDPADYDDLREALGKLRLNDAAIKYEPETSAALGFGFRCGFLGLLHMEVVQERLEREYNIDLITTAPTVIYKIYKTDGSMLEIDNPALLPDPSKIEKIEEPMVKAEIHVPSEYVGAVLKLCQDRRGRQKDLAHSTRSRVVVTYEIPLAEIVFDFFDRLKSVTKGYASLDYEVVGYEEAPLIRLDILVNAEPVDALSVIVHRERAYYRGRALAAKLKELIDRQQYEIAIQAAIGTKIIARETVRAFRKNVTAKCYGGDISRKRKLLEKQKEGKKRMKQVGSVEIPQEAFLAVLRVDDESSS